MKHDDINVSHTTTHTVNHEEPFSYQTVYKEIILDDL